VETIKDISLDQQFLDKATKAVEAHIGSETFGVTELGDALHVSRGHLHRKIKSLTGHSPSHFIMIIRLQYAKKLLERRVATVAEIGYQSGFASATYFSKCFSDYYHCTPGEVLKGKAVAVADINFVDHTGKESHKNSKLKVYAIIGMITLVLFGSWLYWQPIKESHSGLSMAVLPFKNLSNNPEDEYFSIGLAEDIIARVAEIPELRVVSSTSSRLFKDSEKSLKEIGDALAVNHILEGTVRKSGSRARITVHLIDVMSDKRIWSNSFDTDVSDIFNVQQTTAQEISNALRTAFQPKAQKSISIDAYNLYLMGRQHHGTAQSLSKEVLNLYERAIEIDSTFALAYVAIADWYLLQANWRGVEYIQTAKENAKPYITRAIELGGMTPEIYYHFAVSHMWSLEVLKAQQNFEKVIQLTSKGTSLNSSAQINLACLYTVDSRVKEAYDMVEDAILNDPLNPRIMTWRGSINALVGNKEKGIKILEGAITVFPEYIELYRHYGKVLLANGELEKSIQILTSATVKLKQRSPALLADLAIAYSRQGKADSTDHILKEMEVLFHSNSRGSPAYHIAQVEAGLGKIDHAFQWLEQAFLRTEPELLWLPSEVQFTALRRDKRYSNFIKKIIS